MAISRRDFLRLLGVGGAALVLGTKPRLSSAVIAQPREMFKITSLDPRFGALLTVDDGYSQTFVPMVDLIKRKNCPIAFFPMGRMVSILANYEGRNILEELVDMGCIICNHSYSHPYFTHLSAKQIAEEVLGWEREIAKAMGKDFLRTVKARYPYFRIPFGAGKNTPRVHRVLSDLGYTVVEWTWDEGEILTKSHAYDNPQAALKEPRFSQIWRAIAASASAIRRGDIALLHSNWWDLRAFEAVCDAIKAVGQADPETALGGTLAELKRVEGFGRQW